MAETPSKRLRKEPLNEYLSSDLGGSSSSPKRQRPYDNILNLFDEEDENELEPEPSQDLSAILTTLQQELSSSNSSDSIPDFDIDSLPYTAEGDLSDQAVSAGSDGGADDEQGLESVMRHLLEASDDELGIPQRGDSNIIEVNSMENFPFAFSDHGLWEFEDETANYYTVLQSELFM